jgi:GAF domain-containing protein
MVQYRKHANKTEEFRISIRGIKMSSNIKGDYPENKTELYDLLCRQLAALTEGESEPMPNLANASSLLWMGLKDINWAGFYLMKNGELLLGPFQGKPACIHIPVGRGVCGSAAAQGYTLRIEDVHQFPGHIACDGASNSEIVIPIHDGGKIVGVLDIDSPVFARFDGADQDGLEKFVKVLERACSWDKQ